MCVESISLIVPSATEAEEEGLEAASCPPILTTQTPPPFQKLPDSTKEAPALPLPIMASHRHTHCASEPGERGQEERLGLRLRGFARSRGADRARGTHRR